MPGRVPERYPLLGYLRVARGATLSLSPTAQGETLTATTAPAATGPDVSIVRLHGEACYWCGTAHSPFTPAGTVTTPVDGGIRVWFIVACPQHRHRRSQ